MYYNTDDKQQFIDGELKAARSARGIALKNSALARSAWERADAEFISDPRNENTIYRDSKAYASREDFRVKHRQATELRDDVVSLEYELGVDDEYGDLDEYGYAA